MITVINFKTDSKIKAQAQNVAKAMGLNLSDILNIYLRTFVRDKEIYIDLNKNESNPSRELLEAVKSSRKERKAGKMKKFKNVDSAVSYLKTV